MSTNTVCRVCLVDNMNLHYVRNDLQNVYERIARDKYNKVGYPVNMCYICLTVLRKCHRFMETALDTNNVLKQWYNQHNEMRAARPLYTYSISKAEFVSTFNENVTLQSDIIVENVKLEQDEVQTEYPECNTDAKIEKTDIDEQTDYGELLGDRPNDCIYTETIEDNNDGLTYPLFDCNEDFEETSSLAPKLDDHTNIETTIKIISPQDNDIPLIKKRKTKLQHRASKTSGETATTSGTSNDITPVDSNASQHRNTETKPTFCENNRCDKDTANISKSLNTIMIRNETKVLPKKTIKTKSSLKKSTHHVSHTGKKQFRCNNCSFKCTYKGRIVTHMRTHTGEKPFSCNICEYKSARKDGLKSHVLTHSGEQPFSCDICSYKSKHKFSLVTHMRTHSGEKLFSCEICEYKSARKGNLKSHMKTHTGEKPFSCETCHNKFRRKEHLVRHMRTHTGENFFSCDICYRRFESNKGLKDHIIINHTAKKPFSCNICEYKSARKDNLKSHVLTHSGEKPFSCDICSYKSKHKFSLVTHMRTHTGEKPYSCETCHDKFRRKEHLVRHIMRTHTGGKLFSCDICSYKPKHKGNLVTHMRTHTGAKPFSCDICSYKSKHKGNLVRHMRTHTDEKPFSCDICSYKSKHKFSLVMHMRTHTG